MSYSGLLIHTADRKIISVDKWGKRSESYIIGEKCRVMYGNKIVRNFKGEEVTASAKLFFEKTSTVAPNHELRLDAGGRWRAIVKIIKPSNSTAIHHIELWVV